MQYLKKGKAMVLLKAKILFWDKIFMVRRRGFEIVNRTLQDIWGNKDIMGDFIVGDLRQTFAVIPRGTMVDKSNFCLKFSQL